MKSSIRTKLETLLYRHEELAALLADPEVMNRQNDYRKYAKEYADLTDIVAAFKRYNEAAESQHAAEEMLEDSDPQITALAAEECEAAKVQQAAIEEELRILLIPRDPNDERSTFLEIRAGAGGDEAAIFAGDLFRMYSRFAEQMGWRVEIVSLSESEQGGYKEIISRVIGPNVYAKLKFESGAHRVQRVPVTESQGRVHTSTCTVAVMPEVEAVDEVEINMSDVRVDTFRASGAGGQHVNKTDSAIRLTHLPTGMVVECQDERSQHKNRARAMSLLSAKLLSMEQSRQRAEQAQTRRDLVGSGDRSERIRTYNYSQGRVTDHRINLTLYKLDEVMAGDLLPVIDPLIREHQADLLASISEQ